MRLSRATCLLSVPAVLAGAAPDAVPAVAPAIVPDAAAGTAWAWDGVPAMTLEPATLLAYSAAHPPRKDAKILQFLDEVRISFDAQGLKTQTLHFIYRLDHASDFGGWDRVRALWSPWCEERTQIRARVISPDGQVTPLDPATIGEYGAEDESSDVYGDRKGLRAPLPRVAQGAIVEIEMVDREHTLPMKAGGAGWVALHAWVPLLNRRVTLEAPESLPLRWKIRGAAPAQPRKAVRDGRVILHLACGPQEPCERPEPGGAPDQDPRAVLSWGTARDWNALAKEYSGIVEAQIQGAEPEASLDVWTREAIGDAKDRDEKIARILARLHREVRYTGVEFGDAALVPRRPGETLKRGYGDCKDKAALLVASLRCAGIPAQVALLRAGDGRDLDPELPGYGFFNHAIACIPGKTPVWIDATAEFGRLGELPLGDWGRQALVADPGTRALVAIPALDPARNRILETRQYTLREDGPALVKESTEYWGPSELVMRGRWAYGDEKKLQEGLVEYAKGTYSAKALASSSHLDPRDLSRPFRLDLEVAEPGTAVTDRDGGAVTVNFWPLLRKLHAALLAHQTAAGGDKEAEDAPAKQPPARKTDLILGEPLVMEMKVRVSPPAGYVADSIPQAVDLAFGPATFKVLWRVNAQGEVEAEARMHTGKERWTPAEVDLGAAGMKKYGEGKVPMLTFKMLGEAHLKADRIQEALAEFRKLAASEPAKAGPRTRIARALLQAGLGEAARKQAREAIQLDPASAVAQETLAWILEHDLLGRRFSPGWDSAGCEKAYLKARELDPKDRGVRLDLAIMLEHDAQGRRYSPQSRLADAIRIYQELRKEWKHERLDNALLAALGRAGRHPEALDLARELPPTPFRNMWRVCLVTCLKGLDEGLKEAVALVPDAAARRGVLEGAGDLMLPFRRYPEASRLILEGADAENLGRTRARAEFLGRIRAVDYGGSSAAGFDPKDPRTVVKRMIVESLEGSTAKESYGKYLSPSLIKAVEADASPMEVFQAPLRNRDLTRQFMVDLMLSTAQFNCEGDDARGYRIQVEGGGRQGAFYVARQEKGYAIIGFQYTPSWLGYEALWQMDQGHPEQAAAALDRAREVLTIPGEDPMGGAPFPRLWTRGRKAPAHEITDEITRAAASLLVGEAQDARAIPILKEARAKAGGEGPSRNPGLRLDLALKLDLALAMAYHTHRDFAAMEEVTARLLEAHPDSKAVVRMRVQALSGLKRWAEAEALLEPRIQSEPGEPVYQELRDTVWSSQGRRLDLEKAMQRRIEEGSADSYLYNNLAWSQVVRGEVTEKTLEYIRRSTEKDKRPYNQHTLATVLAELGRTREACTELHGSAEMSREGVRSADWYVFGRIAEHLGESEAARDYYRRVDLEEGEEAEAADTCRALARRRLAKLEAR